MASNVTYKKPIWNSADYNRYGKPDYFICLGKRIIGYVKADRAGRSAGTNSHWMAYLESGKRIAHEGTYARMKAEVDRYIETKGIS